jgi:hypothetical protein
MFMVDEASLRIFSSVSKDDKFEGELRQGERAIGKQVSNAKGRLPFSEEGSNSEDCDTVSMRCKLEGAFENDHRLQIVDHDDWGGAHNRSDFFVPKDYKGIRARRSTLCPYTGKKQHTSSRPV